MRSLFMALSAALLLTGCAVSVRPSAVQTPAIDISERLPIKAALTLRQGFEDYHYKGRPTSWSGSTYTADIALGEPSTHALRYHMASAFTVVPAGKADLTIEPAFAAVEWRIDDDGQAAKQAALGVIGTAMTAPAAVVEVRLQLTATDRDGRQVYQRAVTGRGVSQASSVFSFSVEREVEVAASYALSDAVARAVQQLALDPAVRALAAN